MFQTEPILFLQRLGGPVTSRTMALVSELGTADFYVLVVIFALFGGGLHRGRLVGQVLLWTAGMTTYAKLFFALPRPQHVDSRVLYPPAGAPTQTQFHAGGSGDFFSGLPADVVTYYRARAAVAWGFPSGHTSSFSAVAGGLALAFERRWWPAWLAAGSLMALSRMYLGRHFLADVLGGLALAAAVVATADLVRRRLSEQADRSRTLEAAWLWGAPLLLLPLAWTGEAYYGPQLLGLNLAVQQCDRRGAARAPASATRRAISILVGLIVGGTLRLSAEAILTLSSLDGNRWAESIAAFLGLWGLVVLTVAVSATLLATTNDGRPEPPVKAPRNPG